MRKNKWIYKVFLLTFLLSIIFSLFTNLVAYNTNIFIMIIVLALVIVVGISFDMIGTAVLSADEKVLHAMNAQKVKGTKSAINLVKNRSKVANICNDVVGDICGIISGGLGAILALNISIIVNINITLISLIFAALISSLTVCGKALFKNIAVKNANEIIYKIGKIIYIFNKKTSK